MRRALCGIAAVLLSCTACERAAPEPEPIVVAWVDERPLTLDDWQHYLEANLLEAASGGGGAGPGATDRVQSRLFDAFLDERLLLDEARRRGITATDLEVEAWLGFAGGLDHERVTRERWEEARCRVMIQKLEEDVSTALPDVGAADPAAAQAEAADPGGRVVRLSSLRFEDSALAAQVADAIARDRMSFDEALIAHGSPQDGVPRDIPWGRLGAAHRAALEKLRVGQVSVPVEIANEVFLFRVEAWLDGAAAGAVRDEHARRGVERARREAAFAALLSELRENAGIRIKVEALPFTYVAEDGIS